MWDDQHHKVTSSLVDNYTISANFVTNNNKAWWITTIYSSAKRKKRGELQNELANILFSSNSRGLLVEILTSLCEFMKRQV